MPMYLYRDRQRHAVWIQHRMLYSTGVLCTSCGEPMWRVPLAPMINWNGDRGGRIHPKIKQWIRDAPRRRERYLEKLETQHA